MSALAPGLRPISKAQIRAIKARQAVLGMDDATYRGLLRELFSADSCTQLSSRQGHRLLDRLHQGQAQPRRRTPIRQPAAAPPLPPDGTVVELPTPPQRGLIAALVSEIRWEQPGGYGRWLKVSLGLERVRTRQEAGRVIEGLKGLKRHGHGAAP